MNDQIHHREQQGPGRLLSTGSGCLLLAIFIFVIPVLWWLFVPVNLTPLAMGLYLVCVLAICSGVATRMDHPGTVFRAFVLTFLGYALAVAALTAPFAAVGIFAANFGATEVMAEVPSPDGKLTAVMCYIDEGALGGSYDMYVRGWLIPGLLEWHYTMPTSGREELEWVDADTLRVQGREHDMPAVIAVLSW